MSWICMLGIGLSGLAEGQVLESDSSPADPVESPVLEEVSSPVDPDPLGFSRLLRSREHDLAAYPEYLRVAHAHPGSPLADLALLEAGAVADSTLARREHYLWAADRVSPSLKGPFLMLSLTAVYQDTTQEWIADGSAAFEELNGVMELSPWVEPQAYMQGWVLLYEGQEDAAVATFSSIRDPSLSVPSQEVIEALASRDLPHRSPVMAGIMSGLLPGSGQVYSKRIKEGLTSTLVMSLAGLGTYYAYQDSKYLMTGVAGASALVLYGKQISDAVVAARTFNEDGLWAWREELHGTRSLQVELVPDETDELELSIELSSVE